MTLLRITSTTKNLCILAKHSHEALLPVFYDKCVGKSSAGCPTNSALENPYKKMIHTTKVHNDLEGGLKAIGAGLATIGALGPGVGIGLIFQGLVTGAARNPSSAGPNLVNAIMGASFCEILGLMCIVIGFMNTFS